MPKQGTERKIKPGGTPPKPFRTVDATYRSRLPHQVKAIRSALDPQVSRSGAAPVRVKLLSRAAAKSHRPEHLFSRNSCPIIGAGRLGELFVKASAEGLERLASDISSNESDRMVKELSCVEVIEPITPAFRRAGLEASDILRHSPRGSKGFLTRVRLFDFGAGDQDRLVADFRALCERRAMGVKSGGYSPASFTYEVECESAEDVESLARTIGV